MKKIAWSELKVSSVLHAQMERDNKLSDFDNHIHESLAKVIGIKLAENNIGLTEELKNNIQFYKHIEKGNVHYLAELLINESV